SDLVGIASSQNHIVRLESGNQEFDDIMNALPPLLLPLPLEAFCADVVFERLALSKRQMRQFHRLQKSIVDHRRAEARSQAEKQHTATFVTSDRLHQRIVHDARWTIERLFKIEARPSRAEVVGLRERTVSGDLSRIADRY